MKSSDLKFLRSLLYIEGCAWWLFVISWVVYQLQINLPWQDILTTGVKSFLIMTLTSSTIFLIYGYKKRYYTGLHCLVFFFFLFIPAGSFLAGKELNTLIKGWK